MDLMVDPPRNLEVNIDFTRSGATMSRDYFGLVHWLREQANDRATNLLRNVRPRGRP